MDDWLTWDVVNKLACLIFIVGMVAEALILANRSTTRGDD